MSWNFVKQMLWTTSYTCANRVLQVQSYLIREDRFSKAFLKEHMKYAAKLAILDRHYLLIKVLEGITKD